MKPSKLPGAGLIPADLHTEQLASPSQTPGRTCPGTNFIGRNLERLKLLFTNSAAARLARGRRDNDGIYLRTHLGA